MSLLFKECHAINELYVLTRIDNKDVSFKDVIAELRVDIFMHNTKVYEEEAQQTFFVYHLIMNLKKT